MSLGKSGKVLGYKINIEGANKAKSDLGSVGSSLKDTKKAADGLTTSVGSTLGGAFKKAALIAAPMIGIASIQKAFSAAAESAGEWAKVGTILPVGTSAVLKFGAAINSIEQQTGIAGSRLKDRLGSALKVNLADADAIKLIESSATTAAGTMQEFEGVVDATTSVMSAYGEQANRIDHIQTALWIGTKNGAESISVLGMALEQVGPLAAQLKIGYEELIAANSVLAKSGVSGVKGLMALGNVISTLSSASAEAQDEASKLGIVWTAEGVRALGFSNWIEHLSEKLRIAEGAGVDVAASLTKMGLSGRELGIFGLLTKDASRYREVLDDIMTTTDELPQRWAERQDDVDFQMERFKVNLGEVWSAIGTGMIEGMGNGATGVGTAADQIAAGLTKATEAGKLLGENLGDFVKWATSEDGLPAVIETLSGLSKAISPIAWLFSTVVGGAVDLGDAWWEKLNEPISREIKNGSQELTDKVNDDMSSGSALARGTWEVERDRANQYKADKMESAVLNAEGMWASPEQAMMYGGFSAFKEAQAGLKPGELAVNVPPHVVPTPDSPVPQAPNPPEKQDGKLTIEQLLKLKIDQSGKVTGANSSGRVSGSGAADARGIDINASYRFMVIGAGQGEHAVRPMPMNVIMGHVRPE